MWYQSHTKVCTKYDLRVPSVIIIAIIFITRLYNTMVKSIISDITTDIKSITTKSTPGLSSSSLIKSDRKKWNNHRYDPTSVETFKGANVDLLNKVFVLGGSQA